jgi:hypothetical protein
VSLRKLILATVMVPASAAVAHAQSTGSTSGPPLILDPGSPATTPTQPAPTPTPPTTVVQPNVIVIGPDGKPVTQEPAAPADTGVYHYDDVAPYPSDEGNEVHGGPVPELHVVRRGDTLWDICWYYFNDPWQWPKVWSYNPQITNPHWIYPGDLVRLLPKGMGPDQAPPIIEDVEGGDQNGGAFEPPPAKKYEVTLKQVAFVDTDNLTDSITIDGAVDEHTLLSTGDAVYLDYPDDKPPKVGATYSIYERDEDVAHPRTGESVGSYVRILGELQVTSVKKDKRARGVITQANREIERGDLVGPLQKTLKTVPPAPNQVDAQGTIIAMLEAQQVMGEGQVVFIDLGKKSGIQVGNRMYVVRRGDALPDNRGDTIGQDDRRFPARALGEIVIVDVGKKVSIGLITLSTQEMGIGDQVMMQKTPQ